jgi:signal recognition particle GTPase
MVLADLGAKISAALQKLNKQNTFDEKMLNDLLTEIASALLFSDVNIHYINNLRNAVKNTVLLQMDNDMGGANARKLIQSTVVDELTKMLSCENKAPEFVRGKQQVVMFVGL